MGERRNKLRSCLLPGATAALGLALAACTTQRETSPPRTATEQLMISAAADRAAQELALDIPKGTRVFVDASNFEDADGRYAVAAIRENFLERGARLATVRSDADMVVEVRSGALSIDEGKTLVGVPQFDLPIPLAENVNFPELPLFRRDRRLGVAKIAAVSFHAEDGRFNDSAEAYGFAHETHWTVLFFISWTTDDIRGDPSDRE